MSSYDYSDYEEQVQPGDNALAQLDFLAQKQADAEARVAELEAQLEKAKADLKDVAERELPTFMDEMKISKFTTTSGLSIEVLEDIKVSPKKENKPKVHEWLRNHGHEKLLKRKLILEFSPEEHEKANKLKEYIKKKHSEFDDQTDVHGRTLQAFVNRELKAGTEIPQDIFGVFRRRVAHVELPTGKE